MTFSVKIVALLSLFGRINITLEHLLKATFPKPVGLIQRILSLTVNDKKDKDALILDFFSGSGTTGQAVMEQNNQDGGARRYILVQLPEPLDSENKDQKIAADFCDKLGTPGGPRD